MKLIDALNRQPAAVAFGLRTGGGVPFDEQFASGVEAEASMVSPAAEFMRTAGRVWPGDGGHALYNRAASEPPHAGKLQSADGAWWEIVNAESVRSFGAPGDGTDQTTMFSDTAKAVLAGKSLTGSYATNMAHPDIGIARIPAGDYTITSIDTGGRDIIWNLHPDASISGIQNIRRMFRDGQSVHAQPWGQYNHAVAYSVRSGGAMDRPAGFNGYDEPSDQSGFKNRDGGALYVGMVADPPVATVPATGTTYTSTTVVPGTALNAAQVRLLRQGMFILTAHSPQWGGQVTGWAADGSSVTVSGWYEYTASAGGIAGTPSNGVACYISPVTKAFGMNVVVEHTANSHAEKCSGIELDVVNGKADPPEGSRSSGAHYWAYDTANIGSYKSSVAFNARNDFWRGFVSAGPKVAFTVEPCENAARELQTAVGAVGFRYNDAGGIPFQATKGGATCFQISNDGTLEIGRQDAASTVVIDLHSSGTVNGYDSRIQASGGSATNGQGTLALIANIVDLNGTTNRINQGGTMKNISQGTIDSGGTGFRVLRVPN